ncbi:hypothetical protein BDZ90DRAFT_229408 [Jaminaea rosea]|uniref:RING-type domain-containing protein n=1 Tax=Jaminaea rosea TaxID=1569628 RepID=A0A316UYJ9_9BASI|nr:hypothetical protein BDZ90DRAFT_229408 [Jaminaea rosea]PWN30386.1 hypothetical protein BDZ90DRAFT_229408 [Jaminaea rosea]
MTTSNGFSQGGGGGGGRNRGQDISHLLSFTLPPRARPPAPVSRRSRRSGPSQPFNKERYVAAQYRFLVKPTGDYTAYFADADIYLNWGDILSVLIPTSSALSGASTSSLTAASQPSLESHEGAACPICLSPPTAPRMTKCGHVYCYPCILQYLSTTDGPSNMGPLPIPGAAPAAQLPAGTPLSGPTNRMWKRCPICWDAVYARDLKAVKWWDPKAVALDRQGDDTSPEAEPSVAPTEWLRMRLIERPQITTLALPQSSTWPTSSTSPSDQPLIAQHQAPWHFQPDVMTFSKFMLATPDLLLGSLTQDVDELAAEKSLLKSMGAGGPGTGDNSLAYVDLAERKVREQMGKVLNELDTPVVRSTIGQAKNDLKEHDEAEQGRRLREGENLSRRQRRQAEKQQAAAAAAQDDGKDQAGDQGDGAADKDETESEKPTESAVGAEDFLALRASSQGGSYGSRARQESQADVATTGSAPASSSADESATPPPPVTKGPARSRRNLNPPNPSPSSFFFYQASSGQNIFMHPLDIKILHSQFGSYARFPRDIAVKVQSAEEGSMNEELRKRCRYLTHLPRGTDVVFIEIDWEVMAAAKEGGPPPLVSKATLKPYEQVLRARRNKRRDKERREDRAKLKAEEAEAARRPPITTTTGSGGAQAMPMGSGRRSRDSHPDLQLSQSYGSSVGGGGDSAFSNMSGHSAGAAGTSPTFMEAAMWGAERHFPVHPGASADHGSGEEDFPAVAPSSNFPSGPSPPLAPSTRTVWGTPAAARPSFASTLHASSRGQQGGGWDEDVDDAWLELEEGFVLGTNNSKQVRQGRGLNTQQQGQRRNCNANGGERTPQGEKPSFAQRTSSQPQSQQGTPADKKEEGGDSAAAKPPAEQPPAKGKKQRKAKLVLTGGGRGMA